jgi:putative transposase
MHLSINEYYHLYNRSNNNELIFLSEDNYIYFLKKYRKYVVPYCTTVAYCLMPTHFHFLIPVQSDNMDAIRCDIADWLSSYSKVRCRQES